MGEGKMLLYVQLLQPESMASSDALVCATHEVSSLRPVAYLGGHQVGPPQQQAAPPQHLQARQAGPRPTRAPSAGPRAQASPPPRPSPLAEDDSSEAVPRGTLVQHACSSLDPARMCSMYVQHA
jgi:hypothetical protein